MRAAVMRDFRLVVDTVPDPVPQAGEVLVRTLACGICGSDLHALKHARDIAAAAGEMEMPFTVTSGRKRDLETSATSTAREIARPLAMILTSFAPLLNCVTTAST